MQKRILITMLEAGAGHKMPANAVKESIETLYPGKYQVDVIDFAKESGALASDRLMKGAWDFMLAHNFFAKLGYLIMDSLGEFSFIYLYLGLREFIEKGGEYINNYKPDIIFSTHFFCLKISAMVRDKYMLPIKVIGFITDPFDAYSWWVAREADYILVASEESRQKLIRKGYEEKRIVIVPYPIRKMFFKITRSREEIQKEYGIDPLKKTIVTTAGGQGIAKISEYVKEICKMGLPFNILFVCGKNESLKKELEEFKAGMKPGTNLIPLGYMKNMNELLWVSDFTIAKAGASTTFESLLMKSPIIFTDWATYSEKPNVDFAVRNKVGWYTPDKKTFFKVIDEIRNTDVLESYKQNIEKLNLKSGADDIAEFLVKQIS